MVPGSGFEPWPGHCVVFLGKTLYSHSGLSTQEYKWVPAKCWGVTCNGLASHPGGIAIFDPSRLMLQKPG